MQVSVVDEECNVIPSKINKKLHSVKNNMIYLTGKLKRATFESKCYMSMFNNVFKLKTV